MTALLSKVILLWYLIYPVFEQIINVVAIKTKDADQMQLAGNETESSNSCNELLHQCLDLIPTMA